MRNESRELLYIHLHASERFAITSGITFQDFYQSLAKPIQNILLLKHQYKYAEYNMHTKLEFVYQEDVPKLIKGHAERSEDFCWIDFEDEAALSALEGQEIAELLYLSHSKNHLRPPFYRMLNNQYAYLSQNDGYFNKMYFRSIDQFFLLLGNVLPDKMISLKVEKTWLGMRKKSEYPNIPLEIFIRLSPLMAEGIIFSFEKVEQNRVRMEIPLWIIGDHLDVDEMVDDYLANNMMEPDAKLIYIKKTREWALVLK